MLSIFIASDAVISNGTESLATTFFLMGFSVCFLADIAFFFFTISWEYNVPEPNESKNDSKTILNKFVYKGLNAIFVKLWLVF